MNCYYRVEDNHASSSSNQRNSLSLYMEWRTLDMSVTNLCNTKARCMKHEPIIIIPLISTFRPVNTSNCDAKRIQLRWKTVERRGIERIQWKDKRKSWRRDETKGRDGWKRGAVKKRRGSRSARLGCSWCSTGANCPFYYSAGCKSPAKFDAWLTARGEVVEKRGKAGGRGHVSVSTRFPRAFSSDFDRFFSSLLNECVIDENNRSPPDSDFPLANIRRNRNKRTLRLTDKRVRLNSEWGISRVCLRASSFVLVSLRVFSNTSFRLVARTRWFANRATENRAFNHFYLILFIRTRATERLTIIGEFF